MKMFSIQQTPNGRWHLTKQGVDMGVYDTLPETKEAMMRIVHKIIYDFDENGEPLT